MKIISLMLAGILFGFPCVAETSPKILYANAGDNTEGFELRTGGISFSVQQHVLVGSTGNGWFSLPVKVRGDFQMDFDVYGDANDVDSNIFFVDPLNGEGILINNCPQETDTPTLSINTSHSLLDPNCLFAMQALALAPSTKFPNRTWTHIRITKKGNILTDDVGGQILSTDLSSANFPGEAMVGLGYYSTPNLGGNGLIRYAHIRIIQLPVESSVSSPSPEKTPTPAAQSAEHNFD